MTRTERDWLLGKPTDETMIVVDDGVIAMFDEYVKKKCAEAFQRGAAAAREEDASLFDGTWDKPGLAKVEGWAEFIRQLPLPTERTGNGD